MAREADDSRLRAEEARLARRAADGDGAAFALLYDRYEQRISTFCHRLVGNDQDAADAAQDAFVKVLQRLPKLGERELNFGAYLFTAARNASYDVIGRRKKAEAVDEIPEYGAQPVYGEQGDRLDLDPEGAAMLGALQEQVRAANARLPERQREVLALRELEELSYDEIAAMMGMNRNSVAQLISRARIRLRDELRGSALAAVATATPEDERAASLIAARMDGELVDEADRAWLEDHLRDNERGRAMVECMLEAGTSYRAWLPIVPVVWLREATIAKAAEAVGADWTEQIAAGRTRTENTDGARDDGGGGDGGALGAGPGAGSSAAGATGGDTAAAVRRPRRAALAGAIAGVVLLLALGGQLVLGRGDPPQTAAVVTAAPETAQPAPTPTGGAAAEPASTPASASKQKAKAKGDAPAAPERIVTVADGTTTVARRFEQSGRPSSAQDKGGTKRQQKKTSSGTQGNGVKNTGGSGQGKQGQGTASAPADPQPAPVPAPQPEPQPEPAPQPPPETTPPPTTPPTPTTPCRPTALRPC